ncbi:MAG: hypothetical protein HQ522_05195 [Bacteroidetes bacterium]|nr:hypothetical protein [Bacteroidota bacterium]
MSKEEKTIEKLKKELLQLGPMLPGSISEQYNVCGKAGCKCKRLKEPIKHGPYYQLSFTLAGKSSSLFINKNDLSQAYQMVKNLKQFKQLTIELIKANVACVRKNGLKGDKND